MSKTTKQTVRRCDHEGRPLRYKERMGGDHYRKKELKQKLKWRNIFFQGTKRRKEDILELLDTYFSLQTPFNPICPNNL